MYLLKFNIIVFLSASVVKTIFIFLIQGNTMFQITLKFIVLFLFIPVLLFGQQQTPKYFSLPTEYPMVIGNAWEYNEWSVTVDCTQVVVMDTTRKYYTRVEVTNKDRLFGNDLFRLKYSQITTYAKNDTTKKDTLVTHDWEQIDNKDLRLAGYDSKTGSRVNDNSKLWKTTGITADTTFGNFQVAEQQILILDFPLIIGKSWIGSTHPVFGDLLRFVAGIDTLTVDNNVLPSYKVNYGYDDQGIVIHTWFSAFGKTKYSVSLQQFDNFGNPVRIYKLSLSKLVSFSSPSPPTAIREENKRNNIPHDFTLYQNYPNPFNPETTIEFSLPLSTYITLRIYNILGQEVKTVISEQLPAGMHEVKWDGTDNFGNKVSSGIYIYRMETGNGYVKTRKMVFLK